MKFTKLIAAAAFAAVAMGSQSAMADNSDEINAKATILTPVTVTKGDDLNFGRIYRPTSGTMTVTLTEGATPSIATNGGTGGSLVTATFTQGTFSVTGADTPVTYQVVVAGTSGSVTGLLLTKVTAKCAGGLLGGTVGLTRTLTGCTTYGTDSVQIGGEITVDDTAATGDQTVGTILATATYE